MHADETGESCPNCRRCETVILDDFGNSELVNRRCPSCRFEWREGEQQEAQMPTEEPNGRRRLLRAIDIVLDFSSAANIAGLARVGAMGLVCLLFYTVTQDSMAESRRDREMLRSEMKTAHELAAQRAKEQAKLVTTMEKVLDETRQENAERRKKEMEKR